MVFGQGDRVLRGQEKSLALAVLEGPLRGDDIVLREAPLIRVPVKASLALAGGGALQNVGVGLACRAAIQSLLKKPHKFPLKKLLKMQCWKRHLLRYGTLVCDLYCLIQLLTSSVGL